MEMQKQKMNTEMEFRVKELALRERELELRGIETESQRTQARVLALLVEQNMQRR